MGQYILRRLLQAIPLLFLISVVLFFLAQLAGDPLATMGGRNETNSQQRERLARQLGLDQPIYLQYVFWLIGNDWRQLDLNGDGVGDTDDGVPVMGRRLGVLRGDLGVSISQRGRAVSEIIATSLPSTLLLMLTAQTVIVILSLAIGIVSALLRYSFLDNLLTTLSFIFFSMPVFWLGIIMIYTFGVNLDWFPTSANGRDMAINPTPLTIAYNMVLPVLTIALIGVASYSRYIRSVMLEVLSSDYIRTARAKGLSGQRIVFVHALKNASLPLVTLVGLDLPFLLAGAVVTERIFSWPGMGTAFINAVDRSDYAILMGILMMISLAVVMFQLLTDVVYTWLDPRIRLS
jgi:peptide/nickel transport system permease protein